MCGWGVVSGLVGGAIGVGAGALGRRLLSAMRRGVRPPPLWCEAAIGTLWAIIAVKTFAGTMPWWWSPVPLLLGWMSVLLVACDVLAYRLPDSLTLPAYPGAALVLVSVAYWGGSAEPLKSAALGAGLFAGCYAFVRLASPSALGAGDVKLAGSLGALTGAVSVFAVALVMLAAALLTIVGVCLRRRRHVPHGPAMLAPAWCITAFPASPLSAGATGQAVAW